MLRQVKKRILCKPTQSRNKILAKKIIDIIEPRSRILDVGCGDGGLLKELLNLDKRLIVEGIEKYKQTPTLIDIKYYDGISMPYGKEWDYVLLCDVLHHTEDPISLLKECKRVSKKGIIIKDVKYDSKSKIKRIIGKRVLRFWDNFANDKTVFPQVYNYHCFKDWKKIFESLGLKIEIIDEDTKYAWFDVKKLNFFVKLEL